MKLQPLASALGLCLLSAAVIACGDDSTSGDGTDGAGNTGTGATGAGGDGVGGAGQGGGVAGNGGQGTGGTNPACATLVPGPIQPTQFTDAFDGSEDIAFDGAGHIAGKSGNQIILVDAAGATTDYAMLAPDAYGLRFGPDGRLFVGLPSQGTIVAIPAGGGTPTTYASGIATPNGVYADFDGNLWVTEFSGGRVTKIDPSLAETEIATGASPNGVVLDPVRHVVFFTEYQAGRLNRVDDAGAGEPVEVGTVGGALDGLVMDECGNVYAVDQQNSRIYRFALDAAGALLPDTQPEMIAQLPQNVANAQFGSGPGFNPTSLYAAGGPGVVYEVPVGVAGAPIPTVP